MKKDVIYFNYLKVLSMFAVIIIHLLTTAYSLPCNKSIFEEYSTVLISTILHFAVPIFLMVTGSLFLDVNKKIDLKLYYKKYIIKYFLGIVVFGWGFAFLEMFFLKGFSLRIIYLSFIEMLKGNSWGHMWYLYMLFGVMLLIPVIKIIVNNDKSNIVDYLLFLLLIFGSFIPMLNRIIGFDFGFSIYIDGIYYFYLILGYKLNNMDIKCNPLLLFIISLVLFFFLSIWYKTDFFSSLTSYYSFFTILLSVSVFLLFKKCFNKKNKLYGLICNLTSLSYGVYILHMFWINIIYKFFKFIPYGNYSLIKFVMLFFVTSFLSIMSSYVIKKMPLFNRIM